QLWLRSSAKLPNSFLMLLQHSRPATQRRRSLPANPRTPVADAVAHAMHAAASLPVRHRAAAETVAVQIVPVHRTSRSVQHANHAALMLSVQAVRLVERMASVRRTPHAQHDPEA